MATWNQEERGDWKTEVEGWGIRVVRNTHNGEVYIWVSSPDNDAEVIIDDVGISVFGESRDTYYNEASTVNITWTVIEAFIEAREIAKKMRE